MTSRNAVHRPLAESGQGALLGYGQLLMVLPLVLTCLREIGITAFFTRSSAANMVSA